MPRRFAGSSLGQYTVPRSAPRPRHRPPFVWRGHDSAPSAAGMRDTLVSGRPLGKKPAAATTLRTSATYSAVALERAPSSRRAARPDIQGPCGILRPQRRRPERRRTRFECPTHDTQTRRLPRTNSKSDQHHTPCAAPHSHTHYASAGWQTHGGVHEHRAHPHEPAAHMTRGD